MTINRQARFGSTRLKAKRGGELSRRLPCRDASRDSVMPRDWP